MSVNYSHTGPARGKGDCISVPHLRLDHRTRTSAAPVTPPADAVIDTEHRAVLTEPDQIQPEPHTDRVDRGRRPDQQAVCRRQPADSEQPEQARAERGCDQDHGAAGLAAG